MYEALIKKYIISKSLYNKYFLKYSFYSKNSFTVVCIFTKKKVR